jgi:hypothetical protein
MASKAAIAILRADSIEAINNAASRIGVLLNIAPLSIPTNGKDADLLQAQQLEAIGAYLQGLGDALTEQMTITPERAPMPTIATKGKAR